MPDQLSSDLSLPWKGFSSRDYPLPPPKSAEPANEAHQQPMCGLGGILPGGGHGLDCPFMMAACFSADTPCTPPHPSVNSQETLAMLDARFHSPCS